MKAIENAQKAVLKHVYIPKTARIKMHNKMIAEFIGCDIDPNDGEVNLFKFNKTYFQTEFNGWINVHELKFHESWDWLMPVVSKIQSIESESNDEELSIQYDECFVNLPVMCTNIDYVYQAVVEFIKWYNKQKQINGE